VEREPADGWQLKIGRVCHRIVRGLAGDTQRTEKEYRKQTKKWRANLLSQPEESFAIFMQKLSILLV
jgi:hypothetical protein